MKRCMRRFVAFFALLAVAWVALLPLVSGAYAAAADQQPLPPCHQAGLATGAHTPSSADPAAPASPCAHCAFCMIAFVVLPSAPAPLAALLLRAPDETFVGRASPHPADLTARLPDPRGPPARLA
jgi:DUF2946 family protein